ncbi:MAG: alanine--tRNA ligase [archaeon]
MRSSDVRDRFIEFFKKNGHKLVRSSFLIPDDKSVLLTTAGMQQFKPYFTQEKDIVRDFSSKRIISIQKCFRTSDIDDVGDESHLTFLEMLGNFSFSDYFKEECINMEYDFFIKVLGIEQKRIVPSIFKGDKDVPRDEESFNILKKLGFKKIKELGRDDNFWGPTGEEGPCGPTVEFYVDNIEIGNFVFNQYFQDKNKKLELLKQNGVDVGIGLERLTMIVQNKKSVFETDLFEPIIEKLPDIDIKIKRIIADHIKGSVFLISDGIIPSNVEQGYILRRILRRIIRYGKLYNFKENYLEELVDAVISIYKDYYRLDERYILKVINEEKERFEKTLDKALNEFNRLNFKKKVSGKDAFYLYQSFGLPIEVIKDIAKEKKLKVDEKEFELQFKKHQEISKAGAEKKFGGHGFKEGQESSDIIKRLHTATHLLHEALRQVLGRNVQQAGSDINEERLRFDFSFERPLTNEEKNKVEIIVNSRIKEALNVEYREMPYKDAVNKGYLAFFKEKYPERVKVYSIGNFSKEICAGPHVNNTKELGKFKIISEKSSAAGIRRIKAVLY